MVRKIVFLLLLITAFANHTHAQTVDCSKAKTQTAMNACAAQQFAAADKQLNAIYKKLIATLSPTVQAALIQSQRKWIAFRDEQARLYATIYTDGSIAPMSISNSKTETTQARIRQLESLYDELDH